MAKIHEYPIESFELNDNDFLDIDFFDVGSVTYQTRKIKGIAVKQSIDVFVKSTLGAVAISNDYNDLDNLPVIPTPISNHSQLVLDDGTNPHGTTKSDVGLSNVDNTSDLNKPISTATQNALDLKQNELISGTNIKTINGNSVLGSGDLVIGGGVQKMVYSEYAYNMSLAVGFAWDGLTVGSTALVTLLDRWRLQSFAGTGQPDGCYSNFVLPSDYVNGENIRVTAKITCPNGGNTFFGIGLAQIGNLNEYGGELQTEWISGVVGVLGGFLDDQFQFVFSGATLQPNQPFSVMIYRNPQNAGDTNTSTAYLNQLLIETI